MSEAKPKAPEKKTFPKGSIIFKEGETGDRAYMLQHGTVRIFKVVEGKRVTLGMVKPFQVFGELSMMDDSPRMAGAQAEEDVTCLILEKEAVRALMEQAPPGLNTLLLSLLSSMRAMGRDLATCKAMLLEQGIEF